MCRYESNGIRDTHTHLLSPQDKNIKQTRVKTTFLGIFQMLYGHQAVSAYVCYEKQCTNNICVVTVCLCISAEICVRGILKVKIRNDEMTNLFQKLREKLRWWWWGGSHMT